MDSVELVRRRGGHCGVPIENTSWGPRRQRRLGLSQRDDVGRVCDARRPGLVSASIWWSPRGRQSC